MKTPRVVVIDYETEKIESRPKYPPKPVGVSIKYSGKKAKYYSWAHPSGNNCTKAQAKKALKEAFNSGLPVLGHNLKFDNDVSETHMGLKRLHWSKYHDTVFLLFLDNPHEDNLSLKPSSERILNWPPDEQDAVRDWLMKHQPVKDIKLSLAKRSPHYWAGYISEAPAEIVAPYANGDTERTEGLFKHLYKSVVIDRKMAEAYDRERELMPILLDNERQGIRVDLERLREDVIIGQATFHDIEDWVHHAAKCVFNIDSGKELVEALSKAGKLDVKLLGLTPKSKKYKTDKDSLKKAITDPAMGAVLAYRSQLNTCRGTFMEPWLRVAEQSDGLIFTEWNQTKKIRDGNTVGARTGRLSSSPNFQNIPNVMETAELSGRGKGMKFYKSLPPLPEMRSYIIPWAPDHVLIDRDYSGQEARILGHFGEGVVMASYKDDMWFDMHAYARGIINDITGKSFKRKTIKRFVFGMIYGMGYALLADILEADEATARQVKQACFMIFPEIADINSDMKDLAREGSPMVTWGGREYLCQPPMEKGGRRITFEYKMPNCLIQGSGADCTKQGVINYSKTWSKDTKFYLNIHDELMSSVPRVHIMSDMCDMREAMEKVEFDIPMLTEGTWSPNNWADLKPYDEKGVLKYEPEESREKNHSVEPLKVQKVRAVPAKRKAGVPRQDQRS